MGAPAVSERYNICEYLPESEQGTGCGYKLSEYPDSRGCNRPAGHAGQHIAVSYSGLILAVAGDADSDEYLPEMDSETIEAAKQLSGVIEELVSAISDAEDTISHLRIRYRGNPTVQSLLADTRLPDTWDVETPLDTELSAEDALREWLSER